jgi:hypothetical protein
MEMTSKRAFRARKMTRAAKSQRMRLMKKQRRITRRMKCSRLTAMLTLKQEARTFRLMAEDT